MRLAGLQGLKDRLLARGELKIEQLPLSAYGKLEIYKDYILVRCEGPAEEFKLWLDEAFGKRYEDLGDKSVRLEGPRRVLWASPTGKFYTVATVWPSADEGGMRKFPFAFYTTVARWALASKSAEELWCLLDGLWGAFEKYYAEAMGVGSIGEMYDTFTDRTMESAMTGEPEARGGPSIAVGTWLGSIHPDSPGKYGLALAGQVKDMIDVFGDLEKGEEGPGVRLPIARDLALAPQVAFWLRSFRGAISQCDSWPSMILPTANPGDGSTVCLIWRNVHAEDGRLMASDEAENDFTDDLAAEARGSAGHAQVELAESEMAGRLDEWAGSMGGARETIESAEPAAAEPTEAPAETPAEDGTEADSEPEADPEPEPKPEPANYNELSETAPYPIPDPEPTEDPTEAEAKTASEADDHEIEPLDQAGMDVD